MAARVRPTPPPSGVDVLPLVRSVDLKVESILTEVKDTDIGYAALVARLRGALRETLRDSEPAQVIEVACGILAMRHFRAPVDGTEGRMLAEALAHAVPVPPPLADGDEGS